VILILAGILRLHAGTASPLTGGCGPLSLRERVKVRGNYERLALLIRV
jgi:hypothetical protein